MKKKMTSEELKEYNNKVARFGFTFVKRDKGIYVIKNGFRKGTKVQFLKHIDNNIDWVVEKIKYGIFNG